MSLLRIQLPGLKKLESTQTSSQINHMSHVRDRFYFKLTSSGNLLGEYSNEGTLRSRPESALRKDTCETEGFRGEYTSTWYEPEETRTVAALLKIQHKPSSPDQFTLVWSDLKFSDVLFSGEAMLCDGMLIGDYRSGK